VLRRKGLELAGRKSAVEGDREAGFEARVIWDLWRASGRGVRRYERLVREASLSLI
jgi:hypothetical protein